MLRRLLPVLTVVLGAGVMPCSALAADTTAPVITLTSPPEGAVYHQYEAVTSSYTCVDEPGGSGLATGGFGGCYDIGRFGPGGIIGQSSGGPVDTSVPGPQQFTVHAADVAGNQTSLSHGYTVLADTTAPVITVVSPAEGAVVDQFSTQTISFTCAEEANGSGIAPADPFNPFDKGGCSVFVGGFGGNQLSGTALNTFNLGPQTVTVNARDRAGNVSSQVVHYTVVLGPPTIFITTPPEGAIYAPGEEVTASYGCGEGFGGTPPTCNASVANGAPIDTSTLGPHTFTVNAVGSTGRTSTLTHTYTVSDGSDTTKPTITATPSPAAVSNGTITLALSASDPGGSGVASVSTSVDGAPSVVTSGASATRTFTGEGRYAVTYTATDGAGNTSDAQTVTIVVDTSAPVAVAVATPAGPSTGAVTVAVSAVDPDIAGGAGSGVKSVTTSVDGAAAVTADGASAALPFTAEGRYTVTYFATDNAGNTSAPKTISVVIDTTPPAIKVDPYAQIGIGPGGIRVGGGKLSGTATDTRGVTDVRVRLIGSNGATRTFAAACTSCGATASPVSWSLDLDHLSPRPPLASYDTRITARDAAGNVTTVKGPSVTVRS